MPALPQIALFLSAMIFTGIMFRARKHLQLPKTLLSSGILLLIGQVWNLAQTVLGADRLQALLLKSFPVVNDPSHYQESRYSIEGTDVGLVYWRIMMVSGLFNATALLLLGLGLLLHANRLMRDQLSQQHPMMPS